MIFLFKFKFNVLFSNINLELLSSSESDIFNLFNKIFFKISIVLMSSIDFFSIEFSKYNF